MEVPILMSTKLKHSVYHHRASVLLHVFLRNALLQELFPSDCLQHAVYSNNVHLGKCWLMKPAPGLRDGWAPCSQRMLVGEICVSFLYFYCRFFLSFIYFFYFSLSIVMMKDRHDISYCSEYKQLNYNINSYRYYGNYTFLKWIKITSFIQAYIIKLTKIWN